MELFYNWGFLGTKSLISRVYFFLKHFTYDRERESMSERVYEMRGEGEEGSPLSREPRVKAHT